MLKVNDLNHSDVGSEVPEVPTVVFGRERGEGWFWVWGGSGSGRDYSTETARKREVARDLVSLDFVVDTPV